jgi:hypothetical protein
MQPPAEFSGNVVLFDQEGWKQKVHVSYCLAVRPLYRDDAGHVQRLFTYMGLDEIKVRVTQSTLRNENRPPQLRICRTKVVLEPTIERSAGEDISDYRDDWLAKDQYPSGIFYRSLPSTASIENNFSARLQISVVPNAQLEVGHNRSRTREIPPIAQVVNLDKSEFQETPYGGLIWDYEVLPQPKGSDGSISLDTHSGRSSLPKSHPPSSIAANVTNIFEVINERSGPNFANFRMLIPGISIGYRHIKVGLKVDVHCGSGKRAQFPNPDCPGGHHTKLMHCFQVRGDSCNILHGKAETVQLGGSVDTELSVEGYSMKK